MADSPLQLEDDGSEVWFSPSPGAYAAIRINAVEMVKHLQDEEATQAAAAMHTKTYLVCLQVEMDLPFPDRPWYRFRALPIGPHLLPPNEAAGYTADMCIPIFPNTTHPTGRAPVPSERPFPYGNCYYWLDHFVDIRVRARKEGFDETNAVKIPSRAEVMMNVTCGADFKRVVANLAARKPAQGILQPEALPRYPEPRAASSAPPPAGRCDEKEAAGAGAGTLHHVSPAECVQPPQVECTVGDAESISSRWPESVEADARPTTGSIDDLMRMNVFSGPDQDLDLLPLVDLWPDIASRLKEEDIPSPLELYKEVKTIQEIVQQARVRAYAALTAQTSNTSAEPSATTQSASKRLYFGGLATLYHRLVCQPAKRLASHAKRISRRAYVVVWP